MSREWKPGDVALLEVGTPSERIGLRARANDGWRTVAGHMSDATTPDGAEHRPLVVIDPEDREAVRRLYEALLDEAVDDLSLSPNRVGLALREFANPTPPKPEEPTGLGAVVEDADGSLLVRLANTASPWACYAGGQRWSWDEINAVRVLSEGVTA